MGAMADAVFAEMAKEPILELIAQSIRKKEMRKPKRKYHKVRSEETANAKRQRAREHQKVAILKKNNVDAVATADDRGKIFGSRFLDANSKKDVFALPREESAKRKREAT